MARSVFSPTFSLGLLTFGLLTSTSIVNAARADNAVAQTEWSINRVASVASGSYCTMAQKYSDNTIVTFAKNKAGEYSIAFDFVKPQFPNSTATTVSLRPGNGSAQTFSVAPQSDKVVVINLGSNDSFLQAVKSTAKIDLEAGGKSHSFTTSKFAAASNELSDCTGGMKNGAMASLKQPAPEEMASIAPAAGDALKATQPAKITAAPSTTPTASQLIAQPAAPTVISHPDTKDVPRMVAAAPVLAPSNQVDVARIQAENAELKQALADARRNFEKMESLQRENESLKAQSSASSNLGAELSKIKADLAAAQTQNQSLQAQASQAVQAQQASLATTQQIAQLQKQNADMTAQLNAANTVVGQLQAKSTQSEASAQQLAELQKQNAAMKLQVDAATTTISQLQTKAAESTAAATQLATLQKQNTDMTAQLTAANAKVSQLQAKTIQSASAAEQVAALQKQTADMKVQLDAANKTASDLQAKNAQSAAATLQLTDLQKQNADMKVQLAAATTTISQLQAKSAQSAASSEQVTVLQKQVEASNQTIAQLQAKVSQAPAIDPSAAANLQAAQQENNALKQQIASLQSKVSADATADSGVKELQAQLQSATQENNALKTQVAAMQSSSGSQSAATGSNWDLEQATKRYQESQREIQRLASKIQEQQKQFAQEQEQLKGKLFDPAVADQAQRDRLIELEQQVADLQAGKPVVAAQAETMAPVSARAVPVPVVQKAPEQIAEIAPAAGTPENSRQEAEDLPIPSIAMPMAVSSKPQISTTPTASAVISPSVSVKFQSRDDYERMIKAAGINIRGQVEEVAGGNSDTYRGYRWKTDSLYGSVEQRAMKGGKDFDKAVNEYLARAKSRCTGDFAAVPSEVSINADKVKSFEIACLGGKENTSASVVFSYGSDVITTLAHEGKSEAMNLAMEARDRMAGQISSIKTASK